MKRTKWWIRSVVAASVLALAPAVALAAGCGSPPDGSGNWMFVDDVALNMRKIASSSVMYGAYRDVDDEVNYTSSTKQDVKLTWYARRTWRYSASLKAWDAATDTSETQRLAITVDLPPMTEVVMQAAEAVRYDRFRFDAGCLWFNTLTHETLRAIADYGVEGSVRRTWYVARASFRSPW